MNSCETFVAFGWGRRFQFVDLSDKKPAWLLMGGRASQHQRIWRSSKIYHDLSEL